MCSQGGGAGHSLHHLQPALGVPEPLTKQLHTQQPQGIATEVHPQSVLVGDQCGRQVLADGAGNLASLQPETQRRKEPGDFVWGCFVKGLPRWQ